MSCDELHCDTGFCEEFSEFLILYGKQFFSYRHFGFRTLLSLFVDPLIKELLKVLPIYRRR